jgi:hypothetical protein
MLFSGSQIALEKRKMAGSTGIGALSERRSPSLEHHLGNDYPYGSGYRLVLPYLGIFH